MKTKKVTYPTGVWVSFGSQGNIIAAGMMPRRELYYSSKLYHLHPGNEVKKVRCELARALNIIRGDVWYYNLNTTDKDVAEDLRNNGVPIRWDAKKGRFV